jgi:two-component system nitrate/nitrite response regulator NarL
LLEPPHGASPSTDPADGDDVRVLIIAEDPLVRAGLRRLLEEYGRFTIVGHFAPGPDFEDDLAAYSPDVVLWDLGWDSDYGLERLREADWDELPLVVLLGDPNRATAAWRAGARGLLPREASGEALASGLSTVLRGLAVVDPEMMLSLLPTEPGERGPAEALTAREMDVLRLMAEGLANKTIASQLEISEFTVKFHVNAILGKLGAQSRTEAAMIAVRMGLIPL